MLPGATRREPITTATVTIPGATTLRAPPTSLSASPTSGTVGAPTTGAAAAWGSPNSRTPLRARPARVPRLWARVCLTRPTPRSRAHTPALPPLGTAARTRIRGTRITRTTGRVARPHRTVSPLSGRQIHTMPAARHTMARALPRRGTPPSAVRGVMLHSSRADRGGSRHRPSRRRKQQRASDLVADRLLSLLRGRRRCIPAREDRSPRALEVSVDLASARARTIPPCSPRATSHSAVGIVPRQPHKAQAARAAFRH